MKKLYKATHNLHFRRNVVLLWILQSFKHVLNLEVNQAWECDSLYTNLSALLNQKLHSRIIIHQVEYLVLFCSLIIWKQDQIYVLFIVLKNLLNSLYNCIPSRSELPVLEICLSQQLWQRFWLLEKYSME